LKNGSQIVIEERARKELTEINGMVIMPEWVSVQNPTFDVTPGTYVTGYITENGVETN
jgi:methylthioribose-1-phosphate isomerase